MSWRHPIAAFSLQQNWPVRNQKLYSYEAKRVSLNAMIRTAIYSYIKLIYYMMPWIILPWTNLGKG
jgi:hypothetical protein